ncbi:MAG: HAMP domain-containing protein [Lachnospiraceae bacterium]|nr:HAMP domain-containing protein [Lachnospiraceae bacterium]
MKHKALIKLILCYVVAAVSMFVLLNFVGGRSLNQHLTKEKVELLTEEAMLIAEEYVAPYYQDSSKLSDVMVQLRSIDNFLGTRIWVVNTNGIVFVDTGSTARGSDVDEIAPEFLNRLVEQGYEKNVYFSEIFEEEMLAVAQPLYYNYRLRGYVCIFIAMSNIMESTYQYLDFVNLCYLVFLVILLAVFGIIYWNTLRPIRKMTRVTREYAKGHFDVPMNIRMRDEYKDLADTIKYMADEFKNLEAYQKKFLANISHDFRSPLTSIKGYAEAMADGTIPYEMQNKYLDIILFEAERLTKLTTNLLELNSFETKGVILNEVSFDINEVIRKTALTFEGTCTKKRITLNLIFGDESLLVDADKDKIQQVLYNLLDNAIKFSNADSFIDIRTEEKGSKVFVSVKDYGIGIPKESISHIWERFYKTDLSRGKDKKGTGLGLSIAKEIIQAHKENINVVSTEGVGTEFMFTLPRAEF